MATSSPPSGPAREPSTTQQVGPAPDGEAAQLPAPEPGTPPEALRALAVLRSKQYLALLGLAAILGAPIAAAAYGFLALVDWLQKELFTHLPQALGYTTAPTWWPLPLLLVGGVLTALAIRYLPGDGGVSPAGGFAMHPAPAASALPGIILAALASLAFGAVIGPEMPLVALGAGLAVLIFHVSRRPVPPQAQAVIGGAGSFAAISTLLGSPLTGAFLIMEAAGLGGPTMAVVLVPGLLAAGVGALIFVGLDTLTGLGAFSLAIADPPPFTRPTLAEFGWAIVIGLAAAVVGPACMWLGRFLHRYAVKRVMVVVPLAGIAVGLLTIIYTEATGKPASDVLFSGENDTSTLVGNAAGYSVATLLLLLICKGLAYSVSLSSFRGGPIFPAIFIGTVGGIAMSHLPGLSAAAAIAMGIGAMSAAVLRLPLVSVLLASLLLGVDAAKVMPLVIVAVVVAYVAVAHLSTRLTGLAATATRQPPAQAEPAS